jgi:DNA-binding PadR family transcriptional regulator
VNDLNDQIVKEMLNIINSHEIYGFEILSMFKEKYNNLDDTLVYSSLKSLEKEGYITTFKKCEDGNCCVKIRYCLSEKGHEVLNSLT